MTGAVIDIDGASAIDTILSIKQRVFAANRKLYVRRQRLVYRPGPRGMEALANDETLGGAGVVQDGTAELDVVLAELTDADVAELGPQVCASVADTLLSCIQFHIKTVFRIVFSLSMHHVDSLTYSFVS